MPFSLFSDLLLLGFSHPLVPSLPLSYSHFSTSTYKPPHVSAVQTEGGMCVPLGSPPGYYMSNIPDRGEKITFSAACLAGLFLPMFGKRKWVLCAVGTSLSSPAPTQTGGRQKDRLKIALGAQVSFKQRKKLVESVEVDVMKIQIWKKLDKE